MVRTISVVCPRAVFVPSCEQVVFGQVGLGLGVELNKVVGYCVLDEARVLY